MKKKPLIVFLSIFVFFYIAYLFIIPGIINLINYKDIVFNEIKKSTNLDVKTQSIKVYTTPLFKAGLKIRDLNVNYIESQSNLVSAKEVDVSLKLLPLLLLKVELNKILLDTPVVNVKILHNGKTDIEEYITKKFPVVEKKDVTNSEVKPQDSFIKISNNLPKVYVKNYKFNIDDMKSKTNLSIYGEKFTLAGNIIKSIKLSLLGDIKANNEKLITYDVNIDSFIPKVEVENKESNVSQDVKLDLTPISRIVKQKFKSNIVTDLKIREGNDKNLNIDGFFNIDELELLVNNKLLKNNSLNCLFNKNNIDLKSQFSFADNQSLSINTYLTYGKKQYLKALIKSEPIELANVLNLINTVLDIFCVDLGTNDLKLTGSFLSDISLETDMKKFISNGILKIDNAQLTHNLIPLKITQINTNLDFSNNSLNIKNTQALINGAKIIATGSINEQAQADISIKSDVLPLNNLFNAFAPVEIKNNYSMQSGRLSLNSHIQGNLKTLNPSVKINAENLALYDKINKIKLFSQAALLDITTDLKTFNGKLNVKPSFISLSQMPQIKLNEFFATFDDKNINCEPFNIYIGQSLVNIKGGISNYTKDLKIAFDADGKLNTADLSAFIPKEYHSLFSAKGVLPIKAQLLGDAKNIDLQAQLLANDTNNFSILDISKLKNKTTLLNLELNSDYKTLKIKNSGLFFNPHKIELSQNLKNNLQNTNNIIKINGSIVDLNKEPIFKNFNISISDTEKFAIPLFKKSEIYTSGNLTVTGSLFQPNISGQILIPLLEITDLFLTGKDININLKNNKLDIKLPFILLNGSDFKGTLTTANIFNPIFIIQDININSEHTDADKLFVVLDEINVLINKLFPPSAMTKASTPADIPVKINSGKALIKSFKMGEIKSQNISSDFVLNKNILTLNNLIAYAYDGKITGNVDYNLLTTLINANVKGSNLNANNAVSDCVGIKNQLFGTADFNAKLSLKGITYEEQMQSLSGVVDFNVLDGNFGSLGKFENFISAQNLLGLSLISKNLNSTLNAVSPKNTAKFDTLKGHVSFNKSGYIHINDILSTGPQMSLKIVGKFHLLNNNADLKILGNVSNDIVSLLGPIANISTDKIVQNIPSFGKTALSILKTFNQSTTQQEINNLPKLSGIEKQSKAFLVLIDGNILSPKAFKTFKWLTTDSEVNTAEASVNSSLKDVVSSTVKDIQAAKDSLKETTNSLKESGKSILNTIVPKKIQTSDNVNTENSKATTTKKIFKMLDTLTTPHGTPTDDTTK